MRLGAWSGGALLIAIAAAAILAAVGGWPGRDYRNQDFFQYYAGAAAVAAGSSPYDQDWWRTFSAQQESDFLHNPPQGTGVSHDPAAPASADPAWTTAYPLYLFVLILPIGLLPLDVAAALWLVAQLAGIVAGLAFVTRAMLAGRRRHALLLLLLTLAFQPLWHLVVNGNVTALVFAAFAGAVGMTMRRRPAAAGALLAVCAVKPQSVAIAAIVLVATTPARDRLRLLLGGTLVGVPLLAISFWLQPDWVAHWWVAASALQDSQFSNATGWTIGRLAPGLPTGVGPIAVGATIALLGAWLWALRPAPAWAIAAATPVSVFAAPHGWTYDHIFLLVPAAVITAAVADAPGRIGRLVAGTLVVVCVPIAWALYAQHVALRGEELSAILPLVMFALVLFAHRALADTARPTLSLERLEPASVR